MDYSQLVPEELESDKLLEQLYTETLGVCDGKEPEHLPIVGSTTAPSESSVISFSEDYSENLADSKKAYEQAVNNWRIGERDTPPIEKAEEFLDALDNYTNRL